MASDWPLAGDLLEETWLWRESNCELLWPEGGTAEWAESLETACLEEEELVLGSSCSRRALSADAVTLLRSGGGDGDDEEEEAAELEEEDEEEDDLWAGGTVLDKTCSLFSRALSCSASFGLALSRCRSREAERLVLLCRCGEGDCRDLVGGGLLLLRLLDLLSLFGLTDLLEPL